MSLTYFIENTDQTLDFSLSPGEKDGFGGTSRNTDLTLHGYGVLAWGEAVNENQLRLLENHACPEKELNDYNPVSEAYDYDPATDPLLPKDENDFGSPSKGINLPTIGQLWYNKTQDRTFVFSTSLEWVLTASGIPTGEPASPTTGDLWYDIGVPQLKIWDGASWDSVAERYVLKSGDTMTGTLTLAGPPSSDLHAATKKYVDDQIGGSGYVSKSGDTMTGILTLSGPPVAGNDAATMNYVNQQVFAAGYVLKAGDTMTGDLFIRPGPGGGDGLLEVFADGAATLNLTSYPALGYPSIQFFGLNNFYPGAKYISRITARDTDVFTWESDLDFHHDGGSGANTTKCMQLTQDGLLIINGTGAVSGAYATHCTIPLINFFGAKMLTTKEYVDDAIATAVGASGGTDTFITPVPLGVHTFSGAWQPINAGGVVPVGATSLILDFDGRASEGADGKVLLRQLGGGANQYVGIRSGQGTATGSPYTGSGCQAKVPCNSLRQSEFYCTASWVTFTIRLIGYS